MSPTSEQFQVDSLGKGLGMMAAANLLQRAIGFLRNFAFCFLLAKNDVGLWALASSFFVLAAPLSVLGLPGCFGRFVETFRRHGQLADFLKHTITIATVGLLLVSIGLLGFSSRSSLLIFGVEVGFTSMLVVTLTLISVVAFNTVIELLNGLRQPTAVSQMQLVSSLGFSLISLPIAVAYPSWLSIVCVYAVSMLLGLLPGVYRLHNRCKDALDDKGKLERDLMMKRVLPFAVTVWSTDLLSNLFDVADRYMLLYFASSDPELNQSLVAQFHAARILPVLFLSLAAMMAGLLLPYWSSEWESGQRPRLVDNYNTSIKLASVFFWFASIAAIMASPLLFQSLLDGQYNIAEACFPLALVHCVIASLVLLQGAMLRCVELNRISVAVLVVSFAVNVGGNAWLVPLWGVQGAMVATLVSTAIMFALNSLALMSRGVVLPWRTIIAVTLPLTLLLPVLGIGVVAGLLILVLGRTNWVISPSEREAVDQSLLPVLNRFGVPLRSLWPVTNQA